MIQIRVNGKAATFDGDPEMPLLWFLEMNSSLREQSMAVASGCVGPAQCM